MPQRPAPVPQLSSEEGSRRDQGLRPVTGGPGLQRLGPRTTLKAERAPELLPGLESSGGGQLRCPSGSPGSSLSPMLREPCSLNTQQVALSIADSDSRGTRPTKCERVNVQKRFLLCRLFLLLPNKDILT